MINEINILHERHCSDFACHSGEKTAGLLCVVSYHHKIVLSHGASFRPCVLAYLYRFGINAEHIFGSINGSGYILADFFCKSCRKLTSGIELSPTDQVWKILLTLIMQSMKKKILAVESEGFGGYAESNYFEVRELGDNATSWDVSR